MGNLGMKGSDPQQNPQINLHSHRTKEKSWPHTHTPLTGCNRNSRNTHEIFLRNHQTWIWLSPALWPPVYRNETDLKKLLNTTSSRVSQQQHYWHGVPDNSSTRLTTSIKTCNTWTGFGSWFRKPKVRWKTSQDTEVWTLDIWSY